MKENKIIKYLWLILLMGGAFYGWFLYDGGKENRINSKYQILCDKNISDYETLSENVYDWITETQHDVTADSLSYLMLLRFVERNRHEMTMDFLYIVMEDSNPSSNETSKDKLNIYNNFKYAFDEAFSKVMNLPISEKKIFKKENICHVYQKYIIDMAPSKININDEAEKFCDGFIISKKFSKRGKL